MNIDKINERIAQCGVIPRISLAKAEDAVPLGEALMAGGIGAIEITFRTSAAAEGIRQVASALPEMLVGAGTILNVEDLKAAADAGAQFAVSPGFNPVVVEAALKTQLPFSPGVMTPTEVEKALGMGLTLLKFFPAEAAGGTAMIKTISAPYSHRGLKFLATGGINAANCAEYLALQAVVAVGGSWIGPKKAIAAGDWSAIQKIASETAAIVRQARA